MYIREAPRHRAIVPLHMRQCSPPKRNVCAGVIEWHAKPPVQLWSCDPIAASTCLGPWSPSPRLHWFATVGGTSKGDLERGPLCWLTRAVSGCSRQVERETRRAPVLVSL